MALCCFLEEIRPRDPVPGEQYPFWLEVHLTPFEEFEFKEIDAWHLVAIACASYDRASTRDLTVLLKMKGGLHCFDVSFDGLTAVEILQTQWIEGLAGVFLTSVGSIVGGLAYDQITGRPSGPPPWANAKQHAKTTGHTIKTKTAHRDGIGTKAPQKTTL
ncbi:MAG TPA: hypothetical protein VKY85_18605 [Candidatus Angelobacter sp.]|nr:hypothetical protein [Candidatus Angelobacter sp.]